jgi:hypothetical protein
MIMIDINIVGSIVIMVPTKSAPRFPRPYHG